MQKSPWTYTNRRWETKDIQVAACRFKQTDEFKIHRSHIGVFVGAKNQDEKHKLSNVLGILGVPNLEKHTNTLRTERLSVLENFGLWGRPRVHEVFFVVLLSLFVLFFSNFALQDVFFYCFFFVLETRCIGHILMPSLVYFRYFFKSFFFILQENLRYDASFVMKGDQVETCRHWFGDHLGMGWTWPCLSWAEFWLERLISKQIHQEAKTIFSVLFKAFAASQEEFGYSQDIAELWQAETFENVVNYIYIYYIYTHNLMKTWCLWVWNRCVWTCCRLTMRAWSRGLWRAISCMYIHVSMYSNINLHLLHPYPYQLYVCRRVYIYMYKNIWHPVAPKPYRYSWWTPIYLVYLQSIHLHIHNHHQSTYLMCISI